MKNNYYLVVLSKGQSFHALQDKFYELDGFYTPMGYAFPAKNEGALTDLLKPLDIHVIQLPLGTQTFESLKLSYKTEYFQKQLREHEQKLVNHRDYLDCILGDDITVELVESKNIPENKKNELIHTIHECSRLKKAIEWSQKMEKVLSKSSKNAFTIKSLSERDQNFLLEDAPLMPRLVNIVDGDKTIPWLRKGIVGMVVGAGGVGKTHLLTQLALSIASGLPFLDKYTIEKQGSVFLGLGENGEDDIHRLLRKTFKRLFHLDSQMDFEQEQKLEKISQRLYVMSFTGMNASFIQKELPTALFEMLFNELKSKEPEEGWSCIILDPISRFLGADAETDNAAATAFMALLERFPLELKGNPTVLCGHHMNKSGVTNTNTDQAAARGSSALTDASRWQVNLEKVERKVGDGSSNEGDDSKYDRNRVKLRVVKSNFTEIPPPHLLKKDNNGCLFSEEQVQATKKQLKYKVIA